MLKDLNDDVLHTEVKNVGQGGSWYKIAHEYVVDLSKTEEKEGKLMVFVENEEPKREVWFDSLYIKLMKEVPEIVQENYYNAMGNSLPDLDYVKENEAVDNYTLQNKERQREQVYN